MVSTLNVIASMQSICDIVDMPVRAQDWIARHAVRYSDKVAAVDLHTGRRFSYRELHRRVGRLAGHLRDHCGVQAGDRVAHLGPSTTDVYEIQFACQRLGAVFLPMNWRLALPELDFIVGDAEPTVLFYDREFTETAQALSSDKLRYRVEMRVDGEGSPYEMGIASASPVEQMVPATHDDVIAIMYTSGTTGRPKGALLTHGMTFYNAVNLSGPAQITRDAVHLVVLPLFHTGGLNCYSNVVFHAGGTNLVVRSFDVTECLKQLLDPELGVTHFFGVPNHYQAMSELPEFTEASLGHLVTCGVGAAPCPHTMLEIWGEKNVPLQQGYGLTETSPTVLVLEHHEAMRRIGSAGLPAMHTDVRLVGADGTNVSRPGEVGEIWVRGPNVTPGYFNREEATRLAFDGEWLKTGDAATRDEDGYYTIVDRWKDMYISGGENVYPAEVEDAIYELDAVAEVAVVGIKDEKWGEVGFAVIALKADHSVSEQEVIEHCRARLARFKAPKAVRFVARLSRNASGKVRKHELRASFASSEPR